MVTAKKANLFRLRLKRVPEGIEVSVLTEPELYKSFTAAINGRRSRGHEVTLQTVDGSSTIIIPRDAAELIERDRSLVAFLFQENPTTLVCPISRTKDQLIQFAQSARDFVSRWYESRLQPISVETTIAVRLAESIDMATKPAQQLSEAVTP